MYERSRKRLQVDYIDYYLLHNISGGIQACKTRFIDNGMLDFLLEEKRRGGSATLVFLSRRCLRFRLLAGVE